ncbi:leucine/isoleucine/valine transporter permease subunit domain protein, partial [Bordetella holmesii 35009]
MGSTIVTVLPELLRGFADFPSGHQWSDPVVIVLFLPQGIWDPARFKRWLRQGG